MKQSVRKEYEDKINSLVQENTELKNKLDDTEFLLRPLASENVELREKNEKLREKSLNDHLDKLNLIYENKRLFGYWHEVNKLTLELDSEKFYHKLWKKATNHAQDALIDKCNDNIRLNNDKKKLEKDIEFNNEVFQERENNYKDLITELKEEINEKRTLIFGCWGIIIGLIINVLLFMFKH